MVFDQSARIAAVAQKEHEQIYPKPGWVEHDPLEILRRTREVIAGALEQRGLRASDLAAIGITNQRETTVLWERKSGKPVANAIVWQDTRVAEDVARFAGQGGQDRFRRQTGLPLSTYFSSLKLRWLLENVPGARERAAAGELLFPHVYPSSLIDGRGPYTAQVANVATSQEEAIALIDKAKAKGFTGVKFYGTFSAAWLPASIAEAHKLGLHVHGHVPVGIRPMEAIDDGYDEITHIYWVIMQAMPDSVIAVSNSLARIEGPARYAKDVDLEGPAMKLIIDTMASKQIAVDPKLFDGYIGRYQLAPDFILAVTREGDHLFTQATGQPKVELFPESNQDYFLKVVDAQITFVIDSNGRGTELILHQGGRDQHAKRIEGEPPPAKEHKEVTVDPKLFNGYIGRYQLAPNFILTITQEDDHLFQQATGQPKFQIYPENERDYFLKVVDAQITFVTDGNGRATELILHQGGMDQHAKRIE